MTEPITIHECRHCGRVAREPFGPTAHDPLTGNGQCLGLVEEVRLFREEDVRPLWSALRGLQPFYPGPTTPVLDAFPAPEEWVGTQGQKDAPA